MDYLPDTVNKLLSSSHTETYVSPIPAAINEENISTTPVIVGVDEAGRGPIFGSMVYSAAYMPETFENCLNTGDAEDLKFGFDDSKKLTDVKRDELFGYLWRQTTDENLSEEKQQSIEKLKENIGYVITGISARDISSGMSKYPPTEIYNLNEQAHDTTMEMIRILKEDNKLNIKHVFIDTVGPPASYQKKLEMKFPDLKFTVSKKADSIYPIVSVASVIAKVTRDMHLKELNKIFLREDINLGSGYPSDPNTVKYLKENVTSLIGWNPVFTRFSWNTTNNYLTENNEKYGTLEIKWEDDFITTGRKRKNGGDIVSAMKPSKYDGILTASSFYDIN